MFSRERLNCEGITYLPIGERPESEDRRLILAYLMNKEIVEKYRIIEYLELFIDTNQYRDNRENAVEKWEEDLEWVRNYKIDEQRHVVIGSVEKYR